MLCCNPSNRGDPIHTLSCLFVQDEMELLNIHHAKGAQIKSRTEWMEEGENNIKYVFWITKD